MKTETGQESLENLLQSPWSSMTLPGLLSGAATLRANAPFLIDAEDVEPLAHRPQRKLSCGQLKSEVELFARQMLALGLKQGEVVILHLPNTVEAIIALLGVQTAGGIPAPAPIFEDVNALRSFVELTGAVGMISIASFAGLHPAQKCRDAATTGLSVRFLAATGANLPDGVVSLEGWQEIDFDTAQSLPKVEAFAPALITFDVCTKMPRALMRSHGQVIADAACAAALARVNVGSRLLVTIPPSSVAGVVYGIALPLLSGAVVELNALFDSCAFGTQLGDGEATVVVLPGASEASFSAYCHTRAIRSESLILVHRPDSTPSAVPFANSGQDADRDPRKKTRKKAHQETRIVDAICLGESLLILTARVNSVSLGLLPQRAHHPVPGLMHGDAIQFDLSLGANGTVMAFGAMVPRKVNAPPSANGGQQNDASPVETGFHATRHAGDMLALCAKPAASTSLGEASTAMGSAA